MNLRTLALLCFAILFPMTTSGEKIRFKRLRIDPKFRSEGVAVGDFNKDGKKDIAAGFVWYEAPDWKMHSITREAPSNSPAGPVKGVPLEYEPKRYSNSFCNFAHDVNHDGWVDLIVCDFPGTPTWWYENPKNKPGAWKKHMLTPVTNNESPQLLDIDGDGTLELLAAINPDRKKPDGPERQMAILSPAKSPYDLWNIKTISEKAAPSTMKYSHGVGAGDINGDGLADIVCPQGWWEAPKSATSGAWKFHKAAFGENGQKAAQMFVYDFDGDGDNDVLATSPHAFGIWWHEQVADNQWKAHEIDKSFSQTHGVCLADMNGDGLPDFVTGKRWWAHGGRDPGGDQPAVFYWFELKREKGMPTWVRHQFDHDSGPGTQFEVNDVNGDGLLDVISSNKKGVHYFEQVRDK